MAQQKRCDASFVVRIWWEDRDRNTEPSVWRGQVQHAASGESIGFRSKGELWDFLRRWTGAHAARDNGCLDNANQ